MMAAKALVGALAVILLRLKELVVEVHVVLASLRELPCGQQQLDEQLVQFLSRVDTVKYVQTKNIPPKVLFFSDFMLTFAMSLMILLVLICSTKVSEISDMAKS